MKKVTRGLFMLSCAFIFMGCPKKEANVEPEIDKETETALDAVWATYVVTDIDQICAFLGENILTNHFYVAAAGSGGTVTCVRDSGNKDLNMSFNKTTCVDGRFRDGTVRMNYKVDPVNNPKANPNANYYRDYGFIGVVTLFEYKVDNWLVKLYDGGAPMYVYNLLPTDKWDPKTHILQWRIGGKILLVHPTDTTRNIIWDGSITKELTNTKDNKVVPSKLLSINWALAKCRYWGKIAGFTHLTGRRVPTALPNKPYEMNIEEPTAIWRDFTCFPDKISSVATTNTLGVVVQRFEEHHPFIRGIASFTTGTPAQNIYPRQIYFGNEGHMDLEPQCDNVGEILIKGISYSVNFRD